MKQSELDIAMNEVLYTVDNLSMDLECKLRLLNNLKIFFLNYGKLNDIIEQDKIEHFNDVKEKTR